eukprot:764082-Hanusia_phi.AAC.3
MVEAVQRGGVCSGRYQSSDVRGRKEEDTEADEVGRVALSGLHFGPGSARALPPVGNALTAQGASWYHCICHGQSALEGIGGPGVPSRRSGTPPACLLLTLAVADSDSLGRAAQSQFRGGPSSR